MNDLKLLWKQFLAENRAFRRNPAAAGFTVAFPLMFMVIFNLLFHVHVQIGGKSISNATFYTPAIIAFSIVSASFTNIAIGIVFSREAGILKRVRGTPLPGWIYIGGRILNSMAVGLFLILVVGAFGKLFYHVQLPGKTLLAFIVSAVVGTIALTACGLAATALVPNEDAAPAVVNFMILPLLFISDVFIPLQHPPAWLLTLSTLFPIKHLSNSLIKSFITPHGSGFYAHDLIALALWGLGATIVATRTFRWEPNKN